MSIGSVKRASSHVHIDDKI